MARTWTNPHRWGVVLLGTLMFAATACSSPAAKAPASHHHPQAKHKPPAAVVNVTFPSPDGVEASWVVAENNRPGTTAWKIPAGTPSGIAGFASTTYAAEGDQVKLYVSTQAPRFHVEAYRMGYYQGDGGRLVWRSSEMPGHVQPTCPITSGVNMVACDNWTPTLTVHITPAFVQGDYLLKLVGSGGQESYVPITIWDPTSKATYLVKNDVFTWQAWNPYGGYDFYAGEGACPSDVYPLCSRARIVSYDRPYAYGQGAGDFMGSELPFIRFIEEHGLDVTYVTDVTVEQHPSIVLHHKTLLSLGHDECWSLTERQAAVAAEQAGVNMVFFGASAVLRHVRTQSSPLGPDRELVDYRDASEDPLNGKGNPLEVTGNIWASPPADWSEVGFVGENYVGFVEPGEPAVPFVVADASAWIFQGTGLVDGSKVPGVIATDLDEFDAYDYPTNLEILGHSPVPLREAVSDQGDSQGFLDSDMTYWTDPKSHAGIFDSGTTNWIPAMAPCRPAERSCPGPIVGEITGNLLALFGKGPAGLFQPSKADWQQIYPSAT
ncbi:MAG: N,N-dimethylformamidase beta subunit family domain-containing protein [Acidimicrobiales bacterium]